MTVIHFPQRGEASKVDEQPCRQTANGQPKPNFEDPHSGDFPEEPRYNKTEGYEFLALDELLALRRLSCKHGLVLNVDARSISLHRPVRYDEPDGSIKSLFAHKATQLPVAEITCGERSGVSNLKASYRMASENSSLEAACFRSLLQCLDRHIETGSPDLPEPDFWR